MLMPRKGFDCQGRYPCAAGRARVVHTVCARVIGCDDEIEHVASPCSQGKHIMSNTSLRPITSTTSSWVCIQGRVLGAPGGCSVRRSRSFMDSKTRDPKAGFSHEKLTSGQLFRSSLDLICPRKQRYRPISRLHPVPTVSSSLQR